MLELAFLLLELVETIERTMKAEARTWDYVRENGSWGGKYKSLREEHWDSEEMGVEKTPAKMSVSSRSPVQLSQVLKS